MATTTTGKQRSQQQFKELNQALKAALDEARVRAHLGTMELKENAEPYLEEVAAATRSAARDLLKRAKQLKAQFAKLHAEHRRAR